MNDGVQYYVLSTMLVRISNTAVGLVDSVVGFVSVWHQVGARIHNVLHAWVGDVGAAATKEVREHQGEVPDQGTCIRRGLVEASGEGQRVILGSGLKMPLDELANSAGASLDVPGGGKHIGCLLYWRVIGG